MTCLHCGHDCATSQWRRTYPSALRCCRECTCYLIDPIPLVPRIRLPTDEERDAKWKHGQQTTLVTMRVQTARGHSSILLHPAAVEPLETLLIALTREGMHELILEIDGFGPRPHHRHGVAIDINTTLNPLGKPATGEGTVLPIVPLAVQCGFLWRPYAARHFELDPARF